MKLELVLVLALFALQVQGQVSSAMAQNTATDLTEFWNTATRLNAVADNQIRVEVAGAAIQSFNAATTQIPQDAFNPPVGTTDVDENNYGAYPYSAIGKVHYTNGGSNFTCSGAIVGTNLVMTAGHCVSAGDGTWHRDWIFSPQYSEGVGEIWEAEQFFTFSAWLNDANYAKDVAFVQIRPIDGVYIGSKYTPLKVEINPNVSDTSRPFFASLGYSGNTLSQTFNFTGAQHAANTAMGLASSQAEGSAGSPWLYKVSIGSESAAHNFVSGLTSYIATDQSGTSFGYVFSPLLDDSVQGMLVEALGDFFITPPADEPFVESKVFLIIIILVGGVILASLVCAVLVCICKPKEDVLREW